MKVKMTVNWKVLAIVICSVLGFASYGWAEDTAGAGQTAQEKIVHLKELRSQNPEAFREELKKHREQVQERLTKLREENPEKFKEIAEKRRGQFREKLEKLRTENPEKFTREQIGGKGINLLKLAGTNSTTCLFPCFFHLKFF